MNVVSCEVARRIDAAAIREYGKTEAELIEAAASRCAEALERFGRRPAAVLAGAGNNAADALSAALKLIERGAWDAAELAVVLRSEKEREAFAAAGVGPSFAGYLRALVGRGVETLVWDGPNGKAADAIRGSALVLDGLTGTGLSGPARGESAELIAFVNSLSSAERGARTVVAVDLPSGLSDGADERSPILRADATLAVEPLKACLFMPFARPFAGLIIPALGVFPPELLELAPKARLTPLEEAARAIPSVPPDSYKHRRGLVEIRAGAVGTTGAAKLACRGAAAGGAGLIRVVADDDIWPVLAASETGAMVRRKGDGEKLEDAPADAILIGPGWGTREGRREELDELLERKAAFVLDADALALLAPPTDGPGHALPASTIVTPHPQEFARFAAVPKDRLNVDPDGFLLKAAAERGVVILLKGHVIRIAAGDGRLAYVDGMEPVLATGGSGDLLAGIVAALAARTWRAARETGASYDPFPVAVAGAALLVEAGRRARKELGFCDASDFARFAAKAAGELWLGGL